MTETAHRRPIVATMATKLCTKHIPGGVNITLPLSVGFLPYSGLARLMLLTHTV